MARIARHCGHAFEGRVIANEHAPTNDGFAGEWLVMHLRECRDGEIKIPFYVGKDYSRTWVLTRTAQNCVSSTITPMKMAAKTR